MFGLRELVLDLTEHERFGISYENIFERSLKKGKLWDGNNLYRVVVDSEANLERLKKHGTDNPSSSSLVIMLNHEVFSYHGGLFEYALSFEKPVMIVVYDGNEFEFDEKTPHLRRFKNPGNNKKIKAVLRIKWGKKNAGKNRSE